MQIDLDPQLTAQISEQVDRGRYPTADEVVREALRLLAQRDEREALQASLVEADAQIDRGEYVIWSPELMDDLAREADQIVRREEAAASDGRR